MADAKIAHAVLKNFSSDPLTGNEEAALAISQELLERLVQLSFQEISSNAAQLTSNETFQVEAGDEYQIRAISSVDSTIATAMFDEVFINPSHSVPVIKSTDVTVTIDFQLWLGDSVGDLIREATVGTLRIDFSEIDAAITLDKLDFQLDLLNTRQNSIATPHWETDAALKELLEQEFLFEDDDFNKLRVFLNALRFVLPDELARNYVEAIEMPKLYLLVPGIVFEGNGRLGVDGDFLLYSARSRLNIEQCPVAPTSGSIDVDTDPSDGSIFVPADSPAASYPPGYGDVSNGELVREGHFFIFTPKKLLTANFEGIAAPSVGFTGGGRKGIIQWGYSASLILQRLDLTLQPPLTFELDIALNALGYGDAGVKIGSVYTRVAGIAFRGDIEPLKIEFKLHFDYSRLEVVFTSRIVEARARNFNFMTNAPWPLSDIAEYLLAKVAEKAIRDQAGTILTSTRIPIARWGELARVGQVANAISLHAEPGDDEITFGVPLRL